MTDELKFSDLRAANVERCGTNYHPIEDWSLGDWFTAVTGEFGELVEEAEKLPLATDRDRAQFGEMLATAMKHVGRLGGVIKNLRRRDVEPLVNGHAIKDAVIEKIGEEAADVVIYVDLLCARAGVDLGAAVRKKFNKVSIERLNSTIVL